VINCDGPAEGGLHPWRSTLIMRMLRLLLPVATLTVAFLVTGGISFANKEIAKKEKKTCTTCHPKGNMKQLNETGKYYKEKKTLEGAPAEKQ
jgi:hypothetical protein